MSSTVEELLSEARKLPLDEQKRLSTQLTEGISQTEAAQADLQRQQSNLKTVDELFGTIKGLDRETLIWLAEDEELCGY